MKKASIVILLFLFLQLFIVVNKQDFIEVNNEATDVIELSQEKVEAPHLMRRSRQTKSWTFMVYMDGDNDLEEVAITDFNEMEYGLYQSGLAEEMNVVIIFDRHSNYDSSNGNWVETRYYQIDPDNNLDMNIESTMISNLGEINMGHPNTLTNFITWALTNYPADHSALVFWDHGNGIDSLCIDETNGDSLTYAEIYDGLVAVNNTLNESLHFDFIGADICFGQLLEVTWQLRNFTDYYVASEASEPTEGWAYDLTFSTFNDTGVPTPEEFITAIIDGFETYYEGVGEPSVTLSGVNCSALSTLIEQIKNLDISLIELMDIYQEEIGVALSKTLTFDTSIDVIDFYGFLENLLLEIAHPMIQIQGKAILSRLNDVILDTYHGSTYSSSAGGIAVTFPEINMGSFWWNKYNLLSFGSDSHWSPMMQAFYNPETIPPIYASQPSISYDELNQALNITVTATLPTNEKLNETNTFYAIYSILEFEGAMLDYGDLMYVNSSWEVRNINVSNFMTVGRQAYVICIFNATNNQGIGESPSSTVFKRIGISKFISPPKNDTDGIFDLSWIGVYTDNGTICNYTVQWSTSENFVDSKSLNINSTTYTFNITPTDQLYYFRIQVITTDNSTDGPWSETITIFIGGPIEPSTPNLICSSAVGHSIFTISWTEAIDYDGDVVGYKLQYAKDSEFLFNLVEIFTTSTDQSIGILEDGIYYFRVMAIDNEGFSSSWSLIVIVEVKPSTPSEPRITTVTPSYLSEKRECTIYWTQATDPDGIVEYYHLQQATDSAFTKNIVNYNTIMTNQTIPVLPLGTYYYRVRGVDNEGLYSSWSNIHSIVVNYPNQLPIAPKFLNLVLLYHENNISLSWTTSIDTDGVVTNYLLEVSDSADFISSITYILNSTSKKLNTSETGFGIKYIRICAGDDAGEYSEWTIGYFLINRLPTSPSILYINGKTITCEDLSKHIKNSRELNNIEVTFGSSKDLDGTISTYEIEIALNDDFTSPLRSFTDTNTLSLQDLIASIEYDTTYYIRIRAMDNYGGVSDWSPTYFFNIPKSSTKERNNNGIFGFEMLITLTALSIVIFYFKRRSNKG